MQPRLITGWAAESRVFSQALLGLRDHLAEDFDRRDARRAQRILSAVAPNRRRVERIVLFAPINGEHVLRLANLHLLVRAAELRVGIARIAGHRRSPATAADAATRVGW